jgi:hypothetical protein
MTKFLHGPCRPRRVLLGAVAAIGMLSGCATDISWRQRDGLDHFVGQPAQILSASLGPPTTGWSSPDGSFVAYTYDAKQWHPGEPGTRDPYTNQPRGPWIGEATCRTIFKLQAGRVVAWSLKGNACNTAPFPPVGQFAAYGLKHPGSSSVQEMTGFEDDPHTARSVVADGTFYTH